MRKKRVTLSQVAEHTGLGITTVSDILNRKNDAGRYNPKTRDKVNIAVKELGYVPFRAAQQLASGKTREIGILFLRDFSNPFWARLLSHIERELHQHDYKLQFSISTIEELEKNPTKFLSHSLFDGLFFVPVYDKEDLVKIEALLPKGMPAVFFGQQPEKKYSVEVDYYKCGQIAARLLHENGHKNINFMCSPSDKPEKSGSKFLGFVDAIPDYDSKWKVVCPDTGDFKDYYSASLEFGKEWISSDDNKKPTAMFCNNDQVAMTSISALSSLGIKIPDDISIIGCDNLPESEYFTPALTTIDNNLEEHIHKLVELLFKQINHQTDETEKKIITPTLVQRKSVKNCILNH
ncbi:MAG: LacI family DNA-binding transcriptional regulator [Kiritimatiellae bacterium]|jgi:DNA-binding LacI/PurR family transcriptional regulator|nr:LacI family DNA-binding transcriptional regulator [Kiritimatiellia bacterium]